ncbi:hypothetical protein [Kineosporia sp. A_224]|uniref:hypothetical protein n=1 Tax=Kineosporia sp. A_224 TaxID=1962180 RepID=UPI00117B179E|nr:hypothetical protein [Kineosporia sp. A_224]
MPVSVLALAASLGGAATGAGVVAVVARRRARRLARMTARERALAQARRELRGLRKDADRRRGHRPGNSWHDGDADMNAVSGYSGGDI